VDNDFIGEREISDTQRLQLRCEQMSKEREIKACYANTAIVAK